MKAIRCLAIIPALFLMLGSGYAPRTPAVPDNAAVLLGESVLIDVLANDTPLGDGLVLERVVGVSHGEALIEEGRVRYVAPDTSSAASTRFGYVVRLANGGQALGVVEVDLLRPVSLTLQGHVPNAAASCGLVASVGALAFDGCIDGQGRFEVTLSDVDPQALVVLTAIAQRLDTDVQGRRFSTLRSAGELAALAGSDGIVDESTFSPLRITPFTTAHHAAMSTYNGGDPVVDADRFETLHDSMISVDVTNRAVVYEAVSTGLLPLQAPALDAYDVIAQRESYDALLDRFTQGEFGDFNFSTELSALVADAANVSPWRSDSVPGRRIRGLGSNLGTIAIGILAGELVELQAGGAARVVDGQPLAKTGSWALDAAGRVVFTQPLTTVVEFERLINCQQTPLLRPFQARVQVELLRQTRVIEGPGVDVSVTQGERTLLNRDELPDGCFSGALDDVVFNSTLQDRRESDLLGAGMPIPQGRVSMQIPFADFAEREGLFDAAAVVDFDTGLLDFDGYQPQFEASVTPAGRLRLQLERTDGSGPVLLDAWRVRADGVGGEQWHVNGTNPGGSARGRGTMAVPEQDPDFFDDPDNVVGRWLSGVDVAFLDTVYFSGSRFEFELDPLEVDGTGLGRQRFVNGATTLRPFRWEVADGVVEMRILNSRLRPGQFADCPEVDPDDCFVAQLRTWQPLLSTATPGDVERMYVLERLQNLDSNGDVVVEDTRNRFFDRLMVEPTPDLTPSPGRRDAATLGSGRQADIPPAARRAAGTADVDVSVQQRR